MVYGGWVYIYQNRFPEAEELFKDALGTVQRTQGTEHPLTPFLMYGWSFTNQ